MSNRITVGELIAKLQTFPAEMPVVVDLRGGGGVSVERRDLVDRDSGEGEPVVAMFASNGGRFGHTPFTEDEYRKKSLEFLDGLYDAFRVEKCATRKFTTIHGDYRIYHDHGGMNDTCYGIGYDQRIIKRMLSEGLLEMYEQPYSIPGVRMTAKGKEHVEHD